ncbi:MAG: Mut7-C RNAse domain-containing protein [Candidatus Bathyarchaeota archaeon]|nr:MAG: Mut7-C RNAse domain-containing protein [Candidatus Bathyarchaeota archaeon]
MDPAFLVDGMLGNLNRWLRICGFETRYLQSAPDEELIELASEGGLTLLTRDRTLFMKAQRAGLRAFLVGGSGDAEELASVARRFGLELASRISRCTSCGASLNPAGREEVRELIPEGSFRVYDEFWVCGKCRKVYWRGSHWKNILETVSEASRIAGRESGPEQDL